MNTLPTKILVKWSKERGILAFHEVPAGLQGVFKLAARLASSHTLQEIARVDAFCGMAQCHD